MPSDTKQGKNSKQTTSSFDPNMFIFYQKKASLTFFPFLFPIPFKNLNISGLFEFRKKKNTKKKNGPPKRPRPRKPPAKQVIFVMEDVDCASKVVYARKGAAANAAAEAGSVLEVSKEVNEETKEEVKVGKKMGKMVDLFGFFVLLMMFLINGF